MASGEALAKKTQKRLRQKSQKGQEQRVEDWLKKNLKLYNQYLRIVAAIYVKVPGDYYGSD
eukprot:9300067-Lingulodinium_polyedra.AAC.1